MSAEETWTIVATGVVKGGNDTRGKDERGNKEEVQGARKTQNS